MDALETIAAAAARGRRRIVLPEGGDARVLQAAAQAAKRNLADIILIGNADTVTADLASVADAADITVTADAGDITIADATVAGADAGDITNASVAGATVTDATVNTGASVAAGITVIDPHANPRAGRYAEVLLRARAAKGMTRAAASAAITEPLTLGACMVAAGDADGCVAGAAHKTADVVRAALQIVGAKTHPATDSATADTTATAPAQKTAGVTGEVATADSTVTDSADTAPAQKTAGVTGEVATATVTAAAATVAAAENPRGLVSSFFLMQHDLAHQALRGAVVFADCALVIQPSAAQLARIACDTADSAVRLLGLTPRVALLSFSTAGSARHGLVDKVREAGAMVAAERPDLALLPEVQFDAAVVPAILRAKAPGLAAGVGDAPANVFIFPDLQSANIAYKIAERIGGARAVGPILQGLRRPVNDLSRGCSVDDIVNLVAVTAVQAA